MKIVINDCYGGFTLSRKAYDYLGLEWDGYGNKDDREKRNDPKLVEAVEKLGEEANGRFARLKVIEIPDDVEWTIEEYDGSEWVAEKHRIWN
jgi:hypothetical protein